MKVLESLKLISISTLLIVGLSACNKPGPAETAGKKIDQSVDAAGKKMDAAGDKVSEKLNEKKQ
jgi:hyperosmotically inducible protein